MIGRVRDRRTFVALRTDGLRVRRGALSIVFLDDGSADVTRIAYAVGKRTGGAVVRNRVRRRLRAALEAIDREGALPSGTMLVGVGPGLEGRSFVQLKQELGEVLEVLAHRRCEVTP